MATTDSLADRVFPLFDHTHDRLTTALVVLFSALLSLYAAWMTADIAARLPTFLVAAVLVGYLLYGRETRRDVAAGGLYMLAAFLAVTPVVYELHWFVAGGFQGVGSPFLHVLSVADLLLFVAFLVLAAVPAVAGFLVHNWERVRARIR